MPEGHTLHRLATELSDAFAGRRVRVQSPQGRFADAAALLDGQELVGAEAWGKHLYVEFPGDRFVHVHLGLIGQFDVRTGVEGGAAGVPDPVGAVRLRMVTIDDPTDPLPTAYADLRGAIICDLVGAARRAEVLGRLGPDPLRPDADPDLAWRRISASPRAIGDLLMDQKVLAGVGNVYRCEVLFRQRIDPFRPGKELRRSSWDAIWLDLVDLLPLGVATGKIVTVAEQVEQVRADLAAGHVDQLETRTSYVYKRQGEPCRVCGSRIRTREVAGRNLYWCGRCQRRR